MTSEIEAATEMSRDCNGLIVVDDPVVSLDSETASELALAAILFSFVLALAAIMLTRSLAPLIVVLLCGPLAGFLSVWVAATALPKLARWAATIAVGAMLAVVFVLTLDGVAGVTLLAVVATAAAVISARPALFVATSVIWLELGVLVLFLD